MDHGRRTDPGRLWYAADSLEALQILIADDHDIVRRGMKQLLSEWPGWEICGEAKTGMEAVRQARELKPDIAILDVRMPELDGLTAASRIRQESPETEILIVSADSSEQLLRNVIEIGVRGFVAKAESARDLVLAVRALAEHRPFFVRSSAELLLDRLDHGVPVLTDRLTPREREITRMIAEGLSSSEIAIATGISVKTAETHRTNVMKKLGFHNVTELVRYALRNKIVEA